MKKIIFYFFIFVVIIGLTCCDSVGSKENCSRCGGDGQIECYKCDGLGKYYNGPLGSWYKCGICMGRGYHYCNECDN